MELYPPHGEAGTVLLQVGIVVGVAGNAEHVFAVDRIGHKGLVAVDVNLAVAALIGGGQGGAVGAGAGLGKAQNKAGIAGHDFSKALLLLLGGAELGHVLEGAEVAVNIDGSAVFAYALGHQHQGLDVHGGAAELLVHAQHLEAALQKCVGKLLGPYMGLVALLEILLGAVALHQVVNALQQQFLFLGKSEIHSAFSFSISI